MAGQGRRWTSRSAARWRALGAATLLSLVGGAHAAQPRAGVRPGGGMQPPEVSPSVLQALEASYLTEEEAKDLRVFHGLWREGDLDTPERRARAALAVGAWDHAWLLDDGAPLLDRAEAMVRRGELEESLAALEGEASLRGLRIKAEALELLGRMADADAVLDVVVQRLTRERVESAADLTEGVRALIARARLRGPGRQGAAAGDYEALAALIARARDEIDRLYWPAYLAEAALLLDKDNTAQGVQAIAQVLSMCPAASEAYALLGTAAVGAFEFERAEAAAAFLDEQHERVDPERALGNSPAGTMVLVRARLRQGDPDEAARLLQPLLERFPRMREGLALSAAIAAGFFEFDLARDRCAALEAISPGSPLAWFEAGERLRDDRQYEQAAEFLGRAIERQPNWARAWIALGLLETQSGRDAAAQDALRRAVALDPFNDRARNSLRLIDELLTYERIETEHFVIRFEDGIDRALALDMPEVLEAIHRRVAGSEPGGIDAEPAQKTTIELMPDHEWFSVRITGMPGIHTIAASTGPVVAMEAPRVGAGHSLGVYDWPRVMQHEYTHTVSLARTNNRIPHWFTEAAAVYLEDAPRDFARWRLLDAATSAGELFDLSEIDVMFVRPRRPSDRALAYAQSHWMYEFIIERWGAQAPLDLMDLFAAGATLGPAFGQVLGVASLEEFQEQFGVWARAQLAAAGMTPRDGQPTLRELLERDAPPGAAPEALAPPSEEQLRSWLEEFPGHPIVLRELFGIALDAGRGEATEQTLPLLRAYAQACPVDDGPHRALARYFLRTPGREGEAIPHLEFLDAREQSSPVLAAELARLYTARREFEPAAAKAERATRISPYDADLRELASRIALVREDLATAERHIHALVILEPDRDVHAARLARVREMRAAAGG